MAAVSNRSENVPCPIVTGPGWLKIYADADPRSLQASRRRPQIPAIRELPGFGMMWSWSLLVLMFVFMLCPPHRSIGVRVNLSEPRVAPGSPGPWSHTVSVYLGGKEGFYVNVKPVRKDALKAKLREELGRQAVWVVYLEGAADTKYENAAYAISAIQDVGAKVVWITPAVRAEWGKKKPM